MSPDGRTVYIVGGDSVAILNRNRGTGTLTQKPGTAGCITPNGAEGRCQNGTALGGSIRAAISPDGKNLDGVAFGASAVTIFDQK